MVIITIAYKIMLWLYTQGADFTLRNYLLGAVKLTKSIDPNKY